MEMSHRSKEYESIIKKAESDLRELLNIPKNYKVLFMQGGGSLQFAMVPMNLLRGLFFKIFLINQITRKGKCKLFGHW